MSDQILIRRDADLLINGWTGIPNILIRDQRLSIEARWLWTFIHSHQGTFVLRMAQMQEAAGVGRDKMRSMIKELIELGYMTREQKVENNVYGLWIYTMHNPSSVPVTPLPATENQSPGATSENAENPQVSPGDVSTVDGGGNPLKKTIKDPSSEKTDEEFDKFWNSCPRKVGKAGAKRKFTSIIRSGVDPQRVLAAMQQLRQAYERLPEDQRRYVKQPKAWLNQGCWEDEELPTPLLKAALRPSSTFVSSNGTVVERG